MNAQVSFGSQPQNRPQALSAQMAPAMTAKVQIGKPKTAVRWATRSSAVGVGQPGEQPGLVRAPRPRPGLVPRPEQVQHAGDPADEEDAEAEDRGGDVHGQPARAQRRDQRAGLGVEEEADEHEGEHHRGEHEQPDVPQPRRPDREDHVGDDGDQHGRRRELVHVAPRQPVGRQPAGDQDGGVRQRAERREPQARPDPSGGPARGSAAGRAARRRPRRPAPARAPGGGRTPAGRRTPPRRASTARR